MQIVPFNPGAMRGPARAVGSLAGLTPARSWRDDLLSLLSSRRSLNEVRDWSVSRGLHYRDEVLPLVNEWIEQGLVKSLGEAKERRVWATKPGDPLPEVPLDAECAPPGAPIGVVLSSQDPRVTPEEDRPARQDTPPTFHARIDDAIIAALSKAGRPTKPADLRAVLGEFTYQQISRSVARLRYQKRMVTHGSTTKVVWSLPGWNNEPTKATAPAPKPAAPPVEKTSLPQAEERKPCSGKCHRDTKPVSPSGELVAIVLIGSREDVLPRLRAALDMVAKRDGE